MSDERALRRLAQLAAVRPVNPELRDPLQESWLRSAQSEVDLGSLASFFVGHSGVDAVLESCTARLLSVTSPRASSLLVVDTGGVIRSRLDGDPSLGPVLDSLTLSPGYDVSERLVGTTAVSLALATSADVMLPAAEHYHPQLGLLTEAAAVVTNHETAQVIAVIAVVARSGQNGDLLLNYAQSLAAELSRLVSGESQRAARAVFERFVEISEHRTAWVVASDGSRTLIGDTAAKLEPTDLRMLTDSAVGSLVLREFPSSEIALPSGLVADVELEAVYVDGQLAGSILSAAPCVQEDSRQQEAVRRQGAHVTSSQRRDYTRDLHTATDPANAMPHRAHSPQSFDAIRDTGDLMTPYLRARHDIATSIKNRRNHLVIGEAGTGKQSLVIAEFRAAHTDGRVLTAECSDFTGDVLPFRSSSGALFHGSLEDGPHLLLIGALETLPPVGARRLDDILRPLSAGPSRPLLVGSINDVTVDASKPYGLVMRYFHETVRVPPLRMRVDDIGDLALEILRKLVAGRSLRLSYQAIRVLEGYSWPGNVSELEDVLRYVVARKPVGEVQARDLPAVCFKGGSRRLSMLESAQCDAIIQALYEAKGNRYKAAAALGIARSSLYRKIDSFGISYIA